MVSRPKICRGRRSALSHTACYFVSLPRYGLHAAVSSVIMGSPSEYHRLLSRSRISRCSSQLPCMSGALDLVTGDEVPILVCIPFLPSDLLPMLLLPRVQAAMMTSPL